MRARLARKFLISELLQKTVERRMNVKLTRNKTIADAYDERQQLYRKTPKIVMQICNKTQSIVKY